MTELKSLHDLPRDFVFDPARASKLMTRHGHGGWLGLSYHAHGKGWVELALPWRDELADRPIPGFWHLARSSA